MRRKTVKILINLKITVINTQGFPGGSAGKESAYNAADLGSIPGLGRSLGERKGYPFQYSGLENSMDYSMESQRVFHFTSGHKDMRI